MEEKESCGMCDKPEINITIREYQNGKYHTAGFCSIQCYCKFKKIQKENE